MSERIFLGAFGIFLIILGLLVIDSSNDPTNIYLGLRLATIAGGILAIIGAIRAD